MSKTVPRRRKQPTEEGSFTAALLSSSDAVLRAPEDKVHASPNNRKTSRFIYLLAVISWMLLSVGVILIGAEFEQRHILERTKVAPSTMELYTGDSRVCAGNAAGGSSKSSFRTYSSADVVPSSETIVHCGACSQCSSMHDMSIYAGTTKTLTDGATWCSTKGFLTSLFLWRGLDVYRRTASECLKESVGFTEPCQECWLDDMECSIQQCIFTCLKSVYLLREFKNKADGSLNKCLECDEKLCGPDFLKCSGSNRRRQGIQSDIARDGAEICTSVTWDWKKHDGHHGG